MIKKAAQRQEEPDQARPSKTTQDEAEHGKPKGGGALLQTAGTSQSHERIPTVNCDSRPPPIDKLISQNAVQDGHGDWNSACSCPSPDANVCSLLLSQTSTVPIRVELKRAKLSIAAPRHYPSAAAIGRTIRSDFTGIVAKIAAALTQRANVILKLEAFF